VLLREFDELYTKERSTYFGTLIRILMRDVRGENQVQIDPTKLEKIPQMNLLQKASLCIIFGEAEHAQMLLQKAYHDDHPLIRYI
jgi:hypothetical protein